MPGMESGEPAAGPRDGEDWQRQRRQSQRPTARVSNRVDKERARIESRCTAADEPWRAFLDGWRGVGGADRAPGTSETMGAPCKASRLLPRLVSKFLQSRHLQFSEQ